MKFLTLQFFKNHWPKILSVFLFLSLFSAYVNIFAVFAPGATLDPNCAPGASGCVVSSQELLVSGTNIKTINGASILGSGDYVISGTMNYPAAGIAISTGPGGWGTSITDNSTNWNTAYSQTRQWDGGSTGLVAATGRASLGLVIGTDVLAQRTFGTAANNNTGDFVAYRTFGTAANSAIGDFATAGHNHTGVYAPVLGVDDNYVTDVQFVVIGNTSGSNTGDETNATIKTKLGVATTILDGYLTSTDWNTFNNKQATLVSGTNIKTINGTSVLGSGDIAISGAGGDVTGPVSAVDNNVVLFNGTTGKVIKDSGLTLSGSNTGDNAVNTLYSGLVSNATHTGDATGSGALTVVAINGTNLAALGTGILKNTTGTGVPSIAVAGDFPTLNQNTTGYAANLSGGAGGEILYQSASNTTGRLGNGTAGQVLTSQGTTLPPQWTTLTGGGMVYPGAGIPLSTGSAWGVSITDNSTNWNTAFSQTRQWDGGSTGLVAATGRTSLGLGTAALNNTGDFATAAQGILATNALPSSSFTDVAVTSKLITGYVSGAGTVAATDTILGAIQKLNGNINNTVSSQWITTGSDIYYNTGRAFIGSTSETTSVSKLALTGTTSVDGSTAGVIGILGGYTFNPSAGGVQVGNRFVITNNPTTAANTSIGEIIRIVDNTSLANLVRGIDITSNAGSNTSGTNTGIRAIGATFGIQGVTTAAAGGVYVPAALYGESTGTTAGDILRLYSTSVTSAPSFATFYHDASAFSGTGLLMDFATGSGSFTGDFADFQKNNVTVFKVTNGGVVSMGLSSTAATSAVCSSLANGTAPTADTAYEIRDCSAAPVADYAEMYPVDSSIVKGDYGDIVTTGGDVVETYDVGTDGGVDWTKVKGNVSKLIKSNTPYQSNVIGIISDNYGDFSSVGYNVKNKDNPLPVALNGRVPVKISSSSESIKMGDYITTSTEAGKAMKAIESGYVVGKALEDWFPESGKDKIMVFVENGYQEIPIYQNLGLKLLDIIDMEEPNIWRDTIISWLGNASNKITRIFTGEICLTDETGESECINRSELRDLKNLLSQPTNTQIVSPVVPVISDTSTSDTGEVSSAPSTSSSVILPFSENQGENVVPSTSEVIPSTSVQSGSTDPSVSTVITPTISESTVTVEEVILTP